MGAFLPRHMSRSAPEGVAGAGSPSGEGLAMSAVDSGGGGAVAGEASLPDSVRQSQEPGWA